MTALTRALSRAKLSEPVRLYLYSIGCVLISGLVLAGYVTGDWEPYLYSAWGVVLAVGGGAEAARASVFSPAGNMRSLLRARRAWSADTAADPDVTWAPR